MQQLTNDELAFFIARITIGINFFIHGAVRLPKLSQFAEGVAGSFEGSLLPTVIALGFAYLIPFVEVILGFLLFLGLKTRKVAAGLGIFIAFLILGSGIREDWGAVGTQMVYAIFIFLLIKNLHSNAIALDINKKNTTNEFTTEG
ncbi:DoxX family membrane protein [Flavobacteriaceae bacterium TK19130]|nr:DoxX family membrane protein [Thermobacterium salinum]